MLDKKQGMEFRLRQYLPDDKHWRWERCWEITGPSGRFQTLGLVQCKHDGFREALVNFKALYQKHAALFILAIWLYLKHIGPDQVKFTFYFRPPSHVASTSAARKELCEHGPSISSPRKAHITGSSWIYNPLQIVKNARCVKADTAFKQISPKNSCGGFKLRLLGLLHVLLCEPLGRGKCEACKNAEQILLPQPRVN